MSSDKDLEWLKERRDLAVEQVKKCACRAYQDGDGVAKQMMAAERVERGSAAASVDRNPHHFGAPKAGMVLWREHAHEAASAAMAAVRLDREYDRASVKAHFRAKRERERDDDRTR